MPTENRSSSNHGTRTFTLDSLTAALEQVQALHEISADLIAENVFGQPAQQGQGSPIPLPEGYMLVERSIWTEQQIEAALAGIALVRGTPGTTDRDLALAAIDGAQCKAPQVHLRDLVQAQQNQGEPVALAIPDECPHLIVFDDTEVESLMFAGAGARSAALESWEKISTSWNAHLFVRVAGNSRDDRHPCATVTDPVEVERLHEEVSAYKESRERLHEWLREEQLKSIALRAQLAERDGHLENALDVLKNVDDLDWTGQGVKSDIERTLSASAEPSAPSDCAICRDLGNQCMECEEGQFREWADRHFAAADYRKTDAGVFIQDWMRHAYSAWCARGALASKQ